MKNQKSCGPVDFSYNTPSLLPGFHNVFTLTQLGETEIHPHFLKAHYYYSSSISKVF